MEHIKQFILRHFEKILVGLLLTATLTGTFFVEEISVVLNFYYLPVLFAAYFLGRHRGVLTAIATILIVSLCAILFPHRFFSDRSLWYVIAQLSSWGGFLLLASIAVGTLYEIKESKIRDLRNAYIGILEILSKYVESADSYTKGHSIRVSDLAMKIAMAMEIPRNEVEVIRVAGLLHDVGKIEISGEVIRKAAELTNEERLLMNGHSQKGANILFNVGNVLKDVVPIVLFHHKHFTEKPETYDGKTIEIPLGARIVAVADAFDAMISDRPYRKGKLPWQALEEIDKNSGTQFDPQVVEAFKLVIEKDILLSSV
jgi:putative nucleotidyltransferase with HDIG domain